jgi:hypothetical protein
VTSRKVDIDVYRDIDSDSWRPITGNRIPDLISSSATVDVRARTIGRVLALGQYNDRTMASKRLRPDMRVVPAKNWSMQEERVQSAVDIVVEFKLVVKVFAGWDWPLTRIWGSVGKWRSVLTDTVPVHRQIFR